MDVGSKNDVGGFLRGLGVDLEGSSVLHQENFFFVKTSYLTF